MAECPMCHVGMCFRCRSIWHGGASLPSPLSMSPLMACATLRNDLRDLQIPKRSRRSPSDVRPGPSQQMEEVSELQDGDRESSRVQSYVVSVRGAVLLQVRTMPVHHWACFNSFNVECRCGALWVRGACAAHCTDWQADASFQDVFGAQVGTSYSHRMPPTRQPSIHEAGFDPPAPEGRLQPPQTAYPDVEYVINGLIESANAVWEMGWRAIDGGWVMINQLHSAYVD